MEWVCQKANAGRLSLGYFQGWGRNSAGIGPRAGGLEDGGGLVCRHEKREEVHLTNAKRTEERWIELQQQSEKKMKAPTTPRQML